MTSARFQNMGAAILISLPANFDVKILAYVIITIRPISAWRGSTSKT